MVPEFGLSHNVISSEKANSVDFGSWICLSRELPAHNKKLPCLSEEGNTFIWREESVGSWALFLAILTIQLIIICKIIQKQQLNISRELLAFFHYKELGQDFHYPVVDLHGLVVLQLLK